VDQTPVYGNSEQMKTRWCWWGRTKATACPKKLVRSDQGNALSLWGNSEENQCECECQLTPLEGNLLTLRTY
jgi:hypothetical protein